jgi:hypothetical protein
MIFFIQTTGKRRSKFIKISMDSIAEASHEKHPEGLWQPGNHYPLLLLSMELSTEGPVIKKLSLRFIKKISTDKI